MSTHFLVSPSSATFPEIKPIYLLTLTLMKIALFTNLLLREACPGYTSTERERERENGNVTLTHSLSFSKVGHCPRIRSTTTDKSFSGCFSSDQIGSSNNCLYSSTFCTSKRRRGIQKGEKDRERERGRNTPAPQICPVRTL